MPELDSEVLDFRAASELPGVDLEANRLDGLLLGHCCRSRFAFWENKECRGERPLPKITRSPFRPEGDGQGFEKQTINVGNHQTAMAASSAGSKAVNVSSGTVLSGSACKPRS